MKRIAIFALCLVLFLCLLVSCEGNGGGEGNTTPDGGNANGDVTTESPTEAPTTERSTGIELPVIPFP